MAAKNNLDESHIDKTSFAWTGLCGICHPGGGAGEFDRDGMPYWDEINQEFGYEKLGKTMNQVMLDGDYALINTANGSHRMAPWDVTGHSEPDCLLCHRSERTISNGKNMNWIWRAASLRGQDGLVDDQNASVKAFASAPTAAQGWFSTLELASLPPGNPPLATRLQIDYDVGINDGSLVMGTGGNIMFSGAGMTEQPSDFACWGCHVTPELKKRGQVWFSEQHDVHFAAFNNRTDGDPANDISDNDSRACTTCHTGDMNHNFAKGNAFLGSVQNVTDFVGFRTCADCHDPASPTHDPNATPPTSPIHTTGTHLQVMSCDMCHIPSVGNPTQLVVDNSATGISIGYDSPAFLSADPLDPNDPDTSRWWPGLKWKQGSDGQTRLYPMKPLLSVWWGDWDQNGTPNDLSDDVVTPIILWRVRQATGGSPLGIVTDDNGDGKPEVNTRAEILAYINALEGNDSYGRQIAARPVLIKGDRIWFKDAGHASGVNDLDFHGTGLEAESSHPFSLSHNVLPPSMALGAGGDCSSCHRAFNGGAPTETFDRLILIDPFDENGQPVYKPMNDIIGILPF